MGGKDLKSVSDRDLREDGIFCRLAEKHFFCMFWSRLEYVYLIKQICMVTSEIHITDHKKELNENTLRTLKSHSVCCTPHDSKLWNLACQTRVLVLP